LLNSCDDSTNQAEKQSKDESGTVSIIPPKIKDTALLYDFGKSFEVLVKAPKTKFKGTILVLQGWNFPNTSWCDNSELCEKALEEGYFLVMPDRKSTRLNSSHRCISYAVFCLKKKKKPTIPLFKHHQ